MFMNILGLTPGNWIVIGGIWSWFDPDDGNSMGFIFGSPRVPAARSVELPSQITDPAVEEARRKEQVAMQKRRGFGAQLLTGGEGVTTQPTVREARLFGSG